MALATVFITIRSFGPMDAPASLAWAIRIGLVLMLVSQAVGVQMIAEGGNTFGAAGALKLPHAFTLHAVQVLPALALLLVVAEFTERQRLEIVALGGIGYGLLITSTMVQTYAGLGPLEPSNLATSLAASGLVVLAVCARHHRARHRAPRAPADSSASPARPGDLSRSPGERQRRRRARIGRSRRARTTAAPPSSPHQTIRSRTRAERVGTWVGRGRAGDPALLGHGLLDPSRAVRGERPGHRLDRLHHTRAGQHRAPIHGPVRRRLETGHDLVGVLVRVPRPQQCDQAADLAAAHDVATWFSTQVLPLAESVTARYVGAATSVAELCRTQSRTSPGSPSTR